MEPIDKNTLVNNKHKLFGALAFNLYNARKARNFTQSELSDLSGVSRSTIALMEKGDSDSKLSSISDIATALEVSPSVLLMTEDDAAILGEVIRGQGYEELLKAVEQVDLERIQKFASTGLRRGHLKAALEGINIVRRILPDQDNETPNSFASTTAIMTGIAAKSAGKALTLGAMLAGAAALGSASMKVWDKVHGPRKPEDEAWMVVLTEAGESAEETAFAIRFLTGMDMDDAKRQAKNTPFTLPKKFTLAEAEKAVTNLQGIGASARVK